MIFMDVNEAYEPVQKVESWALLSSITFKGTFHGYLAIACNTSCDRAITKNMLGINTTEKLSNEQIDDAIVEVVNMVMGCTKLKLSQISVIAKFLSL
ncbi:MAG: chemotaxis protein CheX [Planctomycetota bacterium]|jgi:CheY-specific phosphatase CheX